MALPKRRATYEDIVNLPENLVAELIDGELFASPRPRMRHAIVAGEVFSDLHAGFNSPPGDRGQPGGWWIVMEPELHLGDDVLVPDMAGWRRERLPRLDLEAVAQAIPPDWVGEILSPSNGRLDRVKKLPVYARAGIPHVWLVDPAHLTVEVFALEREHWVLTATHSAADCVRIAPFDAVPLSLGRWWPEE